MVGSESEATIRHQWKPGWYAVADSGEVGKKPMAFRRFGRDLVIFRSNGGIGVLVDRCSHRLAKLSIGRVLDGDIECSFHGLRFNRQGDCTAVPPGGKCAAQGVDAWPVREIADWIWIYHGGDDPTGEPDTFQSLEGTSHHTFSQTWNTSMERIIENNLDYAHLPFVHKRTIGRMAKLDRKIDTEVVQDGKTCRIRVLIERDHQKGGRDPGPPLIELAAPNLWRNPISKRACISAVFAPIDQDHVEVYIRSHLTSTLGAAVASRFFSIANRAVLAEDRRVVETQPPIVIDGTERLLAADRPIAAYRSWLSKP